MADAIGNKAAHDYHLEIPVAQEGFYVKGAAHADWTHSERENTAASSHADRRCLAGICRVSYKRLTPDPVV